ncbi:MAG: CDGSH iron-sulfur domain-containing protein [Longimicrobiales bacterium]|nr:CDGSH iron-sulfur domain-containing protein [Longimicrobiales bacterium]
MTDVKITVIQDGPYKVEGDLEMADDEGRKVQTREGKAVFLCRCGESSTKPFCDGTHNEIGFSGEQSALVEQAYE